MSELFVLEENADTDASGWTHIEDDTVLTATVVDIQRITKNFKDEKTGEPVERVEFTFQVTEDGTFNGRKLKGETSTLFNQHPNCKMRNWVQEILAAELPAGFRFDPEAAKGSNVRVIVGNKVQPRRDGKGDWVSNWVKDVMREKAVAATNGSHADYGEEPF